MKMVKVKNLIVWGIVIVLFGSVYAAFGVTRDKQPIAASSNDMSSHHGGVTMQASDMQSFIGKSAPDFSLGTMDGEVMKLSDYKGKNVVLFFNDGAMCYPACWVQTAAFANAERFNTAQVATFSIVVDQKSEWQKIAKQLPRFSEAKMLFDTTKKVSLEYDVLNTQSSMHPGIFPGHTYFIIDKEGIVQFVLDDPDMAINNNLLASKITA